MRPTPTPRRSAIVVTPWFPNAPGEREGNYVYESARAISENTWSVSVLVSRPYRPRRLGGWFPEWSGRALNAEDFSEFEQVRLVNHLSIPRNLAPRMSDLLLDKSITRELRRTVLDTSATVIHVHTESLAPAAVAVGRATGTKVVVTLHGINVGPRYFGSPWRRERFRRALSSADRVILVGEPLRPFFKELVGRDDHFRCVPNGFSLKRVERQSPVCRDDQPLRFISVSNLHEGKGIDINLVALAALCRRRETNWTYKVIGDGDQRNRLQAMVKDLGLQSRVEFVGAIPHEQVSAHLAAADVFILPSYREAFGIAYLEAMAAGLLTVGVRGQGPSAFIEHGISGLLVPPMDPDGLAQQLSGVLRDMASYRRVAANGARIACEEYTWDRHASAVTAIYEEVL